MTVAAPSHPVATDALVAALCQARRSNQTVTAAPLAATLADLAQAYRVQDEVARQLGWWQTRAAVAHWKAGGPNTATPPSYAPLPPAGVWQARAGAVADATGQGFHLIGVEAELAFRLGRPVSAAEAAALDASADLGGLLDGLCVSIELVDSRWQEALAAPDLLKAADLLCHGGLVLGEWQPYQPWSGHDWAAQRCALEVDGRVVAEGAGGHPCGSPTWVIAHWLRHATAGGATLAKGSVVTTGAWLGVHWAAPGQTLTVRFDGIGAVSVRV